MTLFALLPLAATIDAYSWHLPILLLLVSLVYGATRYDRWDMIFKEAGRWALRLLGFLVAVITVLAAVEWLL